MNAPQQPNPGQPGGHRTSKKGRRHEIQSPMYAPPAYNPPYNQYGGPVLFDDTSGYQPLPAGYAPGYGSPPGAQMAPPVYGAPNSGYMFPQGATQFLNEPMASMALQYGQTLMGQGRQIVDKELEKYISVNRLKYYFAVDTAYVLNKLKILFFPFNHPDWTIKYQQGAPVQPQYEVNAPDLYIPLMALVTYVLVAGVALGMQDRFSPEMLGMQASSALVWLVMELVVMLLTMYVMNINSNTYSLLAYAGYKYVGMVVALLVSFVCGKMGYYIALGACSVSLTFFLIRSLKIQLLQATGAETPRGNKRRTYLLLFVSGFQPLLMWWLTYHLSIENSVKSETVTP